MEIDSAISWKFFEKERFFKLAMESFGFLFGEILKHPEMDMTWCCIKHLI